MFLNQRLFAALMSVQISPIKNMQMYNIFLI